MKKVGELSMDELFQEWWEDEDTEEAIEARRDEDGFPYPPDHFLVSRDAAYNIWCIAYRCGARHKKRFVVRREGDGMAQDPTLGDLMDNMATTVEKFWAASAALSAEDRGAADSYYQRAARPHKLVDGVEVLLDEGTLECNEQMRNFKQW